MQSYFGLLLLPFLACMAVGPDDPSDLRPDGHTDGYEPLDGTPPDTADGVVLDVPDVPDVPDQGDVRCPNGMAFVDFPCLKELECIDRIRFHRARTMWCDELGFDPECCGGGMCDWLPDGECAVNEVCVVSAYGDDRCLPKDCGGDLGSSCTGTSFCDLPTGDCEISLVEGICTDRPTKCGDWPCEYPGCPFECGCDGKTYGSQCERYQAGVSKDADGPCCDTSRVRLTIDNPQGFDRWEACLPKEWTLPIEGINQDLVAIEPGVTCARGVTDGHCPADGITCRGTLDLEGGSSRLTAETWERLCRMGGIPYVLRIEGLGGATCSGHIGAVRYCDSECTDACGCRTCASSDGLCDANNAFMFYRCLDGCWSPWDCRQNICHTTPDDPVCDDYACATVGGITNCWATCPVLLDWWDMNFTDGWNGCDRDSDCHALKGGCESGLPGPCWVAKHVNVGQWETDGLINEWRDVGCTGQSCTCTGPTPSAKCVNKLCVLVEP